MSAAVETVAVITRDVFGAPSYATHFFAPIKDFPRGLRDPKMPSTVEGFVRCMHVGAIRLDHENHGNPTFWRRVNRLLERHGLRVTPFQRLGLPLDEHEKWDTNMAIVRLQGHRGNQA